MPAISEMEMAIAASPPQVRACSGVQTIRTPAELDRLEGVWERLAAHGSPVSDFGYALGPKVFRTDNVCIYSPPAARRRRPSRHW